MIEPYDDSETIDFGTPCRRHKPISDKNKGSRAALSLAMEQLEQLYARVVPLLRRLTPVEAESVAAALLDVHDAVGRTKISLLPRVDHI